MSKANRINRGNPRIEGPFVNLVSKRGFAVDAPFGVMPLDDDLGEAHRFDAGRTSGPGVLTSWQDGRGKRKRCDTIRTNESPDARIDPIWPK